MASAITQEEAEEHIQDIRRRKGVDVLEGQESDNTRDLDRALKLLSDQLYEKETHFLLELIQNADDNTFHEETPEVSFRCGEVNGQWILQYKCNEAGFKRENVEALCRIGDSTKKLNERTRGFIGEKGIGFKSVFKVANIVRIHSKTYSFMLDRRAKLGMISPIVDRSAWQTRRDGTSETHIQLQLNSETEFRLIKNELQKLEPQVLLFLRKISKMCIFTVEQMFHFELTRLVEDQTLDGKETATLSNTSFPGSQRTETKYIIVRFQMALNQTDNRRLNIRETEVVLAFPVDSNMRPLLQNQQTYAYLPINDYGFNYIIQGDFLLVANRESVDSSRWNDNILEVVFIAFVFRAIPRFNEMRTLRPPGLIGSLRLCYTWPLYLQDRGCTNEFWCKLKRRIFNNLATVEILESRHNGQLCRPTSLYYIPPRYRLDSRPLLEDESSALCHLSFAYDSDNDEVLPILRRMGVNSMGIHDFVRELKDLIARRGNTFLESQSMPWHSKVASLLRKEANKTHLNDIPLIPLRNGRWVTFHHNHVFLDEDTSNSTIPRGLDIHLVRVTACRDSSRLAFFQWLGITMCDRAEVCRMIMERYSSTPSRTLADAVDDAIYLFQTPPYAGPLRRLMLMEASPLLLFKTGPKLYVEEPNTLSILSQFAGNPASNMPLLNPAYINRARDLGMESEFVAWVCSKLGISTKPRLVDAHQRLTPEFEFLKANASQDLLVLLRDSWHNYASKLEHINSAFKQNLARMNVLCTDGQMRCLDQTVLPREDLQEAGPNLPFVDIPDADDSRWDNFASLGVLTTKSARLYLCQLKSLALLPVNYRTTISAVRAAYAGLQSSISGNMNQIRAEFDKSPLVFSTTFGWIYLNKCVWGGPRLSLTPSLSSEYPQYRQLFQSCLRLGDVDSNHVVKELRYIRASSDRLKELLLLLNEFLKSAIPSDLSLMLWGKKIFPVKTQDGSLDLRSYDEYNWYFADRQSLWDSFNERLPLLDFDVKTVRTLQPLVAALDMMSRKLSAADEPILEKIGTPIYDEEKSQDLRQRAAHFLLLVTESTAEDRARLLHRLRTLQVWGVPEIRLIHKVHGVLGVEEKGNVIFDDTDDNRLDIYISFNDSIPAIVNSQLTEQFIRHCGIPNNRHIMVGPILTFPLKDLRYYLDQHELDEPLKRPDIPNNDTESIAEDISEDINPFIDAAHDTMRAQLTQTSVRDSANPAPDTETSRQSSLLRERIPTLDQSLSSVRRAATQSSIMPTLIISPSQTNPNNSVLGADNDANSTVYSDAGHLRTSARPGINHARQFSTSTSDHGAEATGTPLDLRDLQATFSEVFSIDTPSRTSHRTSIPAVSASRFNRSPRTPRADPDPESSMLGLHHQHIGLLGETFINDWLAVELHNDWDPIQHWTSRNRNHVYPESPFRGSERDFADFTYVDIRGDLTNLLVRYGFLQDVASWVVNPPTYHLEVKSTSGSCNEPFYMSNNQVDKARGFTFPWDSNRIPENLYVVMRVYNLERQVAPGFSVYVDPWAMWLDEKLSFNARGDYAVTVNNLVETSV